MNCKIVAADVNKTQRRIKLKERTFCTKQKYYVPNGRDQFKDLCFFIYVYRNRAFFFHSATYIIKIFIKEQPERENIPSNDSLFMLLNSIRKYFYFLTLLYIYLAGINQTIALTSRPPLSVITNSETTSFTFRLYDGASAGTSTGNCGV